MALLVVALAAAAMGASGPPTLEVQTPYGTVRGFVVNHTRAFRGIPYSQAPTGKNRFRPPQIPPARWAGVRDARAFGANCIQIGSPAISGGAGHGAWDSLNVTDSSEDCLFINVYTPTSASTGAGLPVLVYLHAGEFRAGSGQDAENNWPYNWALPGSAVLVTLNVRLGMFGMAALDALRSRDPSNSTGNYGMQDQRAGLVWIQQCITAFGGDPNRVTIFGESSGGSSVAYHLTNPRSRPGPGGLFHRAVLESPGLTQSNTWVRANQNTRYVVAALTANGTQGCRWPDATATGSDEVYGNDSDASYGGSDWHVLPGVEINMAPLAVAASPGAGVRLCELRDNCYAVQILPNGTTQLHGTGSAADGRRALRFFNATLRTGVAPGVVVKMRSYDTAGAADCLLGADAAVLVRLGLTPPFTDSIVVDCLAPAEDGVELSAPLATLARTALPKGVDVLAGSNLDEGTEFIHDTPGLDCNCSEADFSAWAAEQYGSELGGLVPTMYRTLIHPTPLCAGHDSQHHPHPGPPPGPGPRPSPPLGLTSASWVAATRSAGDFTITCRARELLHQVRAQGGQAWWYNFQITPIYTYNFPTGSLPYYGAFHGAEVPFVFGVPAELNSDGERVASKAMGCFWVNFAATGNPNTGPCTLSAGWPAWPPIGADGAAIVFKNTSIDVVRTMKKPACDLFARFP